MNVTLEQLDAFDQDRLLAFVEGELDPTDAAALEAELATVPGARELVRALAEDRRDLRSMPEPAPPIDFRRAVEPALARPMLMESRPGDSQ